MPASNIPNTVTKETLFALTKGFGEDYAFLSTLLGLWIHSNMVRSYDFETTNAIGLRIFR